MMSLRTDSCSFPTIITPYSEEMPGNRFPEAHKRTDFQDIHKDQNPRDIKYKYLKKGAKKSTLVYSIIRFMTRKNTNRFFGSSGRF
jgi:hypothetical protein